MSGMSYEHNPMTCPYTGLSWHQLLDNKAEECPDGQAVIMYDMDMQRSTLTFSEFKYRSTSLAAALLDLGLSRGQRVLMIGQTSIPYMVFAMAFGRLGCNTIMVGPGNLTKDKLNLLKTLDCQMIVYDERMQETQRKQLMEGIHELVEHTLKVKSEKNILASITRLKDDTEKDTCFYEDLIAQGAKQNLDKLNEAQSKVQVDDPIVALFTSGSTGNPKIVTHTTHSCVNFFTGSPISLLQATTMYTDRPFSWIAGYIFLHLALVTKLTPVFVPTELALSPKRSRDVFEVWEKEKCGMCLMNVFLIHQLYNEKLHLKHNLSHVKGLLMAGQRFTADKFENLWEMFPGANVLLGYSSSESIKIASAFLTKDILKDKSKIARMGISKGIEIKVVDDTGGVVPRGTSGEICVRNCCIFLEYLGNQEATNHVKTPTGWLSTGDEGIMYDDGKIEVIGRKKEFIKRATVKIFPSEIEKTISQNPSVQEVIVVGVPDQRLHEEICACVVFNEGGSKDNKEKIKELEKWCKKQWPPGPDGLSLAPKYFVVMETIPYTSTAKTSTRQIRAIALEALGIN